MTARLLFPIALILVVNGCASAGSAVRGQNLTCSDVLKPSELLHQGLDCDGLVVKVRGMLRVGPEMRGLWDSTADIKRANYREACVTVYNPGGLAIEGAVRAVEVSGRFRASRPDRLIILGACSDAILEIESVRDTVRDTGA